MRQAVQFRACRRDERSPMAQRILTGCCYSITVLILGAVPAMTQSTSSTETAKPWTAQRTAWGEPDLQGTWPGTAMMGVPLERSQQLGEKLLLTDTESAARAAQARQQTEVD